MPSEAENLLTQLNKSVTDRLSMLFRTAHALAKHGRPFSDFVWLTALHEAKGLQVGNTYRNDKRCQEFIKKAIAEPSDVKLEWNSPKLNFLQ